MLPSIHLWSGLAGGAFVNSLFAMNFFHELRALKTENVGAYSQRANNYLESAWILTFVIMVPLGLFGVFESYAVSDRLIKTTKGLAQLFEARTYVSAEGDAMPYRLLLPVNYDEKKKYPLVVCLHHGGAGFGTDNLMQLAAAEPAQLLSKEGNRSNYPAFILVPQCPPAFSWGGIPDLPSVDSLVFEMINTIEEEFRIDAGKRYIMGVSGGGFGVWHFITARPEMFAAAIPVCGGGDPKLAGKIMNVSIWAFHGAKDRTVPVSRSREMIDAIINSGGTPRYTEFPSEGHYIWNQVSSTPGLLDWLFVQEVDSQP